MILCLLNSGGCKRALCVALPYSIEIVWLLYWSWGQNAPYYSLATHPLPIPAIHHARSCVHMGTQLLFGGGDGQILMKGGWQWQKVDVPIDSIYIYVWKHCRTDVKQKALCAQPQSPVVNAVVIPQSIQIFECRVIHILDENTRWHANVVIYL